MLGYTHDELVGKPLVEVEGSMDEATLRQAVDKVVREGEASFEIQHRRKDGSLIDVFVRARPIRLRGRTCLVGVWRDIGELKAAQQSLRASRR